MRELGSSLDARNFGEIDVGEGDLNLHGQNGEKSITREGEWLIRWKYCGRRGMETIRTVGTATGMPFVRCSEEEAYERRLKWLDA